MFSGFLLLELNLSLSNAINKVGRKNKSTNNAIAIVIAVNIAISEFILNPEKDKTQKPATKAIVVVERAKPTFLNAYVVASSGLKPFSRLPLKYLLK